MKCEICHLNEAARAIRRVVDGEERELYVCDSCARTGASLPAEGPAGPEGDISDVFFNLGIRKTPSPKAKDATCPGCGMTRGELRASRRFGCPKCFETFEVDARTFLSEQVPAMPNGGEEPSEALAARELTRLKEDFSKAVKEDRFEDAAQIADKIRARKDPRRGGNGRKNG